MFFLLYKHTDEGVFDDFSKISHHFPKISEDSSKLENIADHFPKIFTNPSQSINSKKNLTNIQPSWTNKLGQ